MTGTARMGADNDGTSVCDPDARVWDFTNLYLAGCGVVPTALVCNSTLTGVVAAVRPCGPRRGRKPATDAGAGSEPRYVRRTVPVVIDGGSAGRDPSRVKAGPPALAPGPALAASCGGCQVCSARSVVRSGRCAGAWPGFPVVRCRSGLSR
ncbi:GMC oxidoreductase [Streptomyces sp. NPDC056723]|uniref:GMC oxidoreductase n=1 Tax=Streptomyces sp. NPDC056723 TaxID=3345925 RepID=UPI0036BADA93